MNTRATEIGVGLFVLLGLLALSNLSSMGNGDGYRVTARFENIGGLKVRSPVTVGGVRVGKVHAINYDMHTFEAVVVMDIQPQYTLFPEDTSASIFTAGLLGEQYISLEPGGAEAILQAGDQIMLTQSALVLEQIIGQFLFGKASESGDL